ncbi:MAG: hypothetical protein ACLFPV_02345 [Spirochaetaceae bacterium]
MKQLWPRRPLVPALLLILLGALFLPWTSGVLNILSAFWPVPLILIGVVQLSYVLVGKAREGYLFSGFLLVAGGVAALLFLTGIAHLELSRGWPGFVTLTGLVLIGFSYAQPPGKRPSYRIPGLVFLLMSGVFFLFSFDIVAASFSELVAAWWPLIFVLLGLLLLVPRRTDATKDDPNTTVL